MEQLSLFDTPSSRTIRQQTSVDTWVANKCIGTINACVGFGKTRMGIMAIKRFLSKNPNKLVIVVVPSDPIRLQWMQELKNNNLVAEVKTMYDCSKNKYKCALLVIDEIHKIASEQLINIFDNVSYKIILGLTATFERLDGRDRLISQHCPIIDTITTEEAINKGWLSNYREYLILIEPDDIDVYNGLNKEFSEHFSFFNFDFPTAMKLATDWKSRIKYAKDHNLDLKVLLVHAMGFNRTLQARKKYINNHDKKVELTNLILEHRMDRKCVTFSATIAMAEKIKYGKVYSGKDSNKKGRITLEEFINQKTGCLNTVMKLNEGFNDPSLSVAVILGMNSSKTVKTQRRGRVLRAYEGKTVEIFNLVIRGTVEEQWFRNSVGSDNYITIDEENLINLLEGREIRPKKNKQTSMLFRF